MNPARPIVLIELNRTGSGRDCIVAGQRLRHPVVVLTRDPASYPPGYLDGAEVIVTDTGDLDAVVKTCGELDPLAVWSPSERSVHIATLTASALGLVGPDPQAVGRCRDKARQQSALCATGVTTPATVSVRDGSPEPRRAVQSLTPPLIVKPTDGTGSIGVRSFEDGESALLHVDQLLQRRADALVQELVPGPEFSVEMFDGRAVAVMRKHLTAAPDFVETGHDCCGSGDVASHREVVACAAAAAHGLGLAQGPIHVELRRGPQGPVVIEVNPRLAGGQIPAVVKLALGIDLVSETMRWLLGGQPRLHPIREKGAAIRFLLADRAGTLIGISGTGRARRVAGIDEVSVAAPGFQVHLGDFRQRLGYAIGAGDEISTAARAAERAIALLKPEVAATDMEAGGIA